MSHVVGVYYSNWSVYDSKHNPQDLLPSINHVFYAFLKPDIKTGNVKLTDEWADTQMSVGGAAGAIAALMLLKSRNPELKVIASIGGWGTNAEFQEVTANTEKRSNFVNSTIDLVRRFGFDGVDIDWEFPANTTEAHQLVELLKLLRTTLSYINEALTLSVAVPAGQDTVDVLNIPAMDQYLTFWNIMCYDFVGDKWSNTVGYHSNLYGFNGSNALNADLALRLYALRGASTHKLLLGMPAYGRCFLQPQLPEVGSVFNAKFPEGKDTVDFNRIDRSTEIFDGERVAAIAYDHQQNIIVTYDNEQSASIKAMYVRDNGLAGGFWWDSKGDAPNYGLINSFADTLRS
ncbi:hypothetical protein PUMCH_000627 [Australozyma saopauloensis]|uniref:chitinase n=1 Tax=Australozyma saopauloensis TaxID=291208 RepID=A0AAX4H4E9_9ASCO|nr:hypothetical protein PUMCH_000627 [[Candida] saopauloensis]